MKKSIVLVAAMIIAVSASANPLSKKAKAPKAVSYTAETTYDVNGNVNTTSIDAYNVAEIDIPARVRFIEGSNYGINVISVDGKSEGTVRYKVKDGKLRIYSSAEYVENGSFVINLIVPYLPEVKTSPVLNKINVR